MKLIYTTMLMLLMLPAGATIRYVRAGAAAGGNGLSWATAYNNLDNALAASGSADQVWVAQGAYQPGTTTGTFTIKQGVSLYGGFPAGNNNADFADRNWKLYPTYLQKAASYNNPVVTMSFPTSVTTVEGLIIQNGNSQSGGGMLMSGGSGYYRPLILNVLFENCAAAGGYGGGMWLANVQPLLVNVVFRQCRADYGGGLYCDDAAPELRKCAFERNYSTYDGGGVSMSGNDPAGRKALFIDDIWIGNNANTQGGGASATLASPTYLNCTFVNNTCVSAPQTGALVNGGAVNTYSPPGTADASQPVSTITNCVFYNNKNNNKQSGSDVGMVRATTNFSFTASINVGSNPTNGNVLFTASTANLFVDTANARGADGFWFTKDDGLALSLCTAASLIDKGNNAAITYPVDAIDSARMADVPLIADGGSGTAPVVDMGAYENGIKTTESQIAGSLKNAHVVPNVQELPSDFILNDADALPGSTIAGWERSADGISNWTATLPAGTGPSYRFSDTATHLNLGSTTWFRRAVRNTNYCNLLVRTSPVKITVVVPNGSISGYVRPRNSPTSGVDSVEISVYRMPPFNIPGADPNKVYKIYTKGNGSYTVDRIFYGDTDPATVTSSNFRIVPRKTNHLFDPAEFANATLSSSTPALPGDVIFTDTTAIVISGSVYQPCDSCTAAGTLTLSPKTCPLDGVRMATNNTSFTTQLLDGQHGRYDLSVTNPGNIPVTPTYLNGQHLFSPPYRIVPVTASVSGVNFADTTTHVITGLFRANCGIYIGQATLEFTDVLPDEGPNTPQASCVRRRLKVNLSSGYYSIRMPARKYKVEVVGFDPDPSISTTSPKYVSTDSVLAFFSRLPKDSLTCDATLADTVLNLTYSYKPTLEIYSGLPLVCSNISNYSFAIFKQAEVDSFVIRVYRGDKSLGCLLNDTTTKLKLYTSVDTTDNTPRLHEYTLRPNGSKIRLKGGAPYLAPPNYTKAFYIDYIDRFGQQSARLNRNVVVTGVQSQGRTFTTVSPQLPIAVLHDPPGDRSYSYLSRNTSISNSMRMYGAKGDESHIWGTIKIGTEVETGIGVSTESKTWGQLNVDMGVTYRKGKGEETIITTSTDEYFSTSDNPLVIGGSGDVYIGAAVNLVYAKSLDLMYNPANCSLDTVPRLIVASEGFNTQYIYSESHIRNVVMPTLLAISRNINSTPKQVEDALNQVTVWQQVLDNNAANKAAATFIKNISFDAGTGPQGGSTTTSTTKTNTVEFLLALEPSLAYEMGFEIAGSGLTGGVNTKVKIEIGSDSSNTEVNSTTVGYMIADDDAPSASGVGDYYTVDVKRDQAYGTPVFELVAGTSSCPAEPGTQQRDKLELSASTREVRNVAAGDTAYFYLKLLNLSESGEARTYNVNLDQTSSLAGASVFTSSGPFTSTGINVTVGYLAEVPILIGVKRLTNTYSFPGLSFTATSACTDGNANNVSKTTLVDVYFNSPASNIVLETPVDNFVKSKDATPNSINIKLSGYDTARLDNVALQYAKTATGNWITAFSRTKAQLLPGSTTVPWDITYVSDSLYQLRLALTYGATTVYSNRVSGLIDRRAPLLLGNPTPTSEVYTNGEIISFVYDEKLNTGNLNNGSITMAKLNGTAAATPIETTVTGYENKIVITPATSLNTYMGQTIRVIVKDMMDLYGNVKVKPDTSYFLVGGSSVTPISRAVNLRVTNPVVYKNSDSAINMFFTLSAPRNYDTRVNYTITGTARLNVDYTIGYAAGYTPPQYVYFNGAQGAISIAKNTLSTGLVIRPIGNNLLSEDKTILISLNSGGDYGLGDTATAKGTITSEDGIPVYTFNGNGNFDVRSNWLNQKMPLTTLITGKSIFINPSGTCTLNVPLTIRPGASLRVMLNKNFIIPGNLRFN